MIYNINSLQCNPFFSPLDNYLLFFRIIKFKCLFDWWVILLVFLCFFSVSSVDGQFSWTCQRKYREGSWDLWGSGCFPCKINAFAHLFYNWRALFYFIGVADVHLGFLKMLMVYVFCTNMYCSLTRFDNVHEPFYFQLYHFCHLPYPRQVFAIVLETLHVQKNHMLEFPLWSMSSMAASTWNPILHWSSDIIHCWCHSP